MEWGDYFLKRVKSFLVWFGWLFTGLIFLSVLIAHSSAYSGIPAGTGNMGLYLILAAGLSATSMLIFIPPNWMGKVLPLSIPAYLVFIHLFLSYTGGAASPYQPLYLLPIILASLLFSYEGAVLAISTTLASILFIEPAGMPFLDFAVNELPFFTIASLLGVLSAFISTALMRELDIIKALHDTDRAILSSMDRKEVLEVCVGTIGRLIKTDYASIATFDPEGDEFKLEISSFLDTLGEHQLAVPYDSTLLRWAAASRTARYYPEIKSAEVLDGDSEFRDKGIRSLLIVPLIAKGSFLGTLNLGNLTKDGFAQEEIQLAERYALQIAIAIDNANLYEGMRNLFMNTIASLSSTIDARSHWTRNHSEGVADFALAIATELGLDGTFMHELQMAVLLHDIGKIGISDDILNKPSPLSDEEKMAMNRHPINGAAILEPIKELKNIIPIIRHHHERWDGTGYPDGLSGNMIPLGARILSVADAFEAMITDRPYRRGLTLGEAKEELLGCAGSQFDSQVVDAFLSYLEKGDEQRFLQEPLGQPL